jgi:hypothetical protein
MTLNHKISSRLRALYMHLLEILTFYYTCTQLWNQAHNRCRLSPFQHRLMLSQKCRPSGEKLGEFINRWRRHGLLASGGILCRETSSLFCTAGLQALGGGSILADAMVQAQRPDLVILDRSVHGRGLSIRIKIDFFYYL